MTKTEYLFGYPKERYGVELLIIANMRIDDAMDLLTKLQSRVKYHPEEQCKFQEWLDIRIKEVQAAIMVWRKILEEEE